MQRLGQKILHGEGIADGHRHSLRGEVVSHPTVDHDLLRTGHCQRGSLFIDKIADRQAGGVDAHDRRVGDAGGTRATIHQRRQRIGEEDERGATADGSKQLLRHPVGLGWEQQPPGTEPPRATGSRLFENDSEVDKRGLERRLQGVCHARVRVHL